VFSWNSWQKSTHWHLEEEAGSTTSAHQVSGPEGAMVQVVPGVPHFFSEIALSSDSGSKRESAKSSCVPAAAVSAASGRAVYVHAPDCTDLGGILTVTQGRSRAIILLDS